MSSKPRKKSSKSSRTARSKAKPKPAGSSKRPSKAQAREFSAGGVVVRGEEVVTIVPTRRAADGSRVLALPKGHVDPGETPIEAATREVREETGIVGEPVCELGESRYWYRRDGRTIGKTVPFFLFATSKATPPITTTRSRRCAGCPCARPSATLTHEAEREMVTLALAYLHKAR